MMLHCELYTSLAAAYANQSTVSTVSSPASVDNQLLTWLGNENEVGQGIKDSGVPRSDIFITSKLWNTHQPNVKEGLQKSLDALGVDYLDLYVSRALPI